jgi:hypothetical protein
MSYLTIDDAFCDHLRGVLETVELRDASGKLVGHFTPSISVEELALYEKAKRLFDPAEIKRRKETEHGRGYTTEQVVEYLKSLETSK